MNCKVYMYMYICIIIHIIKRMSSQLAEIVYLYFVDVADGMVEFHRLIGSRLSVSGTMSTCTQWQIWGGGVPWNPTLGWT